MEYKSYRWIPFDPDLQLLCASQWLSACCSEHTTCGRQVRNGNSFLPTRLLDVRPRGQSSLRLTISSDLSKSEKLEYFTLSYRWGIAMEAACTTKQNFQEHLHGISEQQLPQTLQDAIGITRAFGVRYLWIDALCIIQRDKNDWQREYPKMGEIYGHSLLTIAASGARSSSGGLFHRREASFWPIEDYTFTTEEREYGPDNPVIIPAAKPRFRVSVEHSALSERGWALQERMLASRTLFWTADGLFWECNEKRASDFGTETVQSMEDTSELQTFQAWVASNTRHGVLGMPDILQHHLPWVDTSELQRLVKGVRHASLQTPQWESDRATWMSLLEEYTHKSFTVATDRLPAIAGIASEISKRTGQEYFSGVWKHNLVRELSWTPCGKEVAHRLPGAPSWSWASINQPQYFWPMMFDKITQLVSIISVSGQEVRVHGRLASLHVTCSSCQEFPGMIHRCVFRPVRGFGTREWEMLEKECATIDTVEDRLLTDGRTFRCIRWMKWKTPEASCIEPVTIYTGAMVLSPVNEKGNIYRRIGRLQVIEPVDWFDEVEETMTLV